MEATLKEDSNYPFSSAHADSTVVPFDLFNKGRLAPFSLFEPSFIATFSITQLRILFCSSVRRCYAQELSLKRISVPFYEQQGEERLFAFQQNAVHSTIQLNIYLFTLPMPFWSAESLESKMH